eukprot:SAG22_NODE_789_length_7224_cov_2.663953_4_plen_83_part_00
MSYEAVSTTVARSSDSRDQATVAFSRNFTAPPHVFGAIATINNGEPALLRQAVAGSSRAVIQIEEDTCNDRETNRVHTDRVS